MLSLDLVVAQSPEVGRRPAPRDDTEAAVDDHDALLDAREHRAEEGVRLQRLALLGVFTFWGASNSSDALPYFAGPGVLFAVAAVLGYRALARPWSRSGAGPRHPQPQR